MAGISRNLLTSMGLTEEQQKTIIEANAETLREIREERDRYKTDAEQLPDVRRQLDELSSDVKANYIKKTEHEKTVSEYEEYKNAVTAKEARAAKEKAARAYFESKRITGDDLDIAMLGSVAQVDALSLKEDGSIKDATGLDGLVSGVFSRLVGASERHVIDSAGPLNGSSGTNRSTNDEMNALIRGR